MLGLTLKKYIEKILRSPQLMLFLLLGYGSLLQHVSVQWGHLRVIHISKTTKKITWFVVILYINEISLVQIIGLY